MSYDLYLVDPVTKETIEIEDAHFMRGGTYCVGGSKELHLNITYNYAPFYYTYMGDKGIRSIYGMTGLDSIPLLQEAASQLGDDVVDDYWEPTEGNAKQALLQLIAMAKMRPDGIWEGD